MVYFIFSVFQKERKIAASVLVPSVSVSVILIGGGRILIVLTFSETPRLHSFLRRFPKTEMRRQRSVSDSSQCPHSDIRKGTVARQPTGIISLSN